MSEFKIAQAPRTGAILVSAVIIAGIVTLASVYAQGSSEPPHDPNAPESIIRPDEPPVQVYLFQPFHIPAYSHSPGDQWHNAHEYPPGPGTHHYFVTSPKVGGYGSHYGNQCVWVIGQPGETVILHMEQKERFWSPNFEGEPQPNRPLHGDVFEYHWQAVPGYVTERAFTDADREVEYWTKAEQAEKAMHHKYSWSNYNCSHLLEEPDAKDERSHDARRPATPLRR